MNQKHIAVIGAGQLGSRHLQALHNISEPLRIQVIDPSPTSLATAKERYESLTPAAPHVVTYSPALDSTVGTIDVAIVACNADYRRQAVEQGIASNGVRFFVLEKYLFPRREDYQAIGDLLAKNKSTAWVNCSMRTQTIYAELKQRLSGQPLEFHVNGGQYGLITNAIHFLDYLAYVTDQDEFIIDTTYLDPQPIPSKRQGFLELNGTLIVHGKKHSHGMFTCYAAGNAPIMMSFTTPTARYVTRDAEQKAFTSRQDTEWAWSEISAPVPFQSAMTAEVVKQILSDGTCSLTPYQQSAKIHLQLLEPLQEFLRSRAGINRDIYPFT